MENQLLIEKIKAVLEKNPCELGAMEDLFGLCRVLTDPAEGHRLNKEVRRYNAAALREKKPHTLEVLLDLQKRSLLFDAPVEMVPNTTSSAARPPVQVAILFSISSWVIR